MPTDFQTLIEIAYLMQCVQEEKTIQQDIVNARDYYNGEHDVPLSERQKEFLGFTASESRFAVNYCKGIVDSITERMTLTGLNCDDETFAEWCWNIWTQNRMDAKQDQVHHNTVNDGETFLMIEWLEGEEYPRLLPHPRYTDPEVDGNGYGCKAHYQGDDPNLPLEYVSKRWVETRINAKGNRETTKMMTLYFPDRIEKYTASTDDESGWEPYISTYTDQNGIEQQEPWPIVRVFPDGSPVGIPWVNFRKPNGKTELWDAIPLQDAINKTALDIIAVIDSMGFPVHLAFGFLPTTDGKPPETDGGNYIKLFPGAWMVIPLEGEAAENIRHETIAPGDLTSLQDTFDKLVLSLAHTTNTPASRFITTKQVAAEGTLKQQEDPLISKVRKYIVQIGNGWEDVFYIARNEARFKGIDVGGENQTLASQWAPIETRDDKELLETLGMKRQVLEIPLETLWSEAGYDANEIAEMSAQHAEELRQTSNIGGALLESFESGNF